MLTLLNLKMHLLVYSNPNSNHMRLLITKDTRVTPTPLCITLGTIVECQQATITIKHLYSRTLRSTKACSSNHLTTMEGDRHQLEEVFRKEGVEEVTTDSEQRSHLN